MKIDRPTGDELAFVFDSWSRSFRKSPYAGCVPNSMWESVSRASMNEIVDRGAQVRVATVDLPDGTRRVMGYIVAEPQYKVIHWIYVKKDYRRKGIGWNLIRAVAAGEGLRERLAGWSYSHRTNASGWLNAIGVKWDATAARIKR